MSGSKISTPATEYFSASSHVEPADGPSSSQYLIPPRDDAKRQIGVSNNLKRLYKDQRIYVNPRTGLPVRPPTSFGLFKHAFRRTFKEGKVNFHEFNKAATEKWAAMSDEEKQSYAQRAKDLSTRFKEIEASCLRRRVRQLQAQVKEYRREVRYTKR